MRQIYTPQKINFPLYRFTKKKWANCFFNTGQLRLGTIFDYAKNESYGDAIHDRHEGYCVFRPPYLGPTGRPALRVTLARNNLVLCLSKSHEEYMYDEFDANCCIRINDIQFFHEIDKKLENEFTNLLLRPVTYLDKTNLNSIPDYEDFAGVMKDSKFKRQEEIRALWEPKAEHINKHPLRFFGAVESNNTLILDYSEEEWFKSYVKRECKTLPPRTLFIPEAIKYCSLVES